MRETHRFTAPTSVRTARFSRNGREGISYPSSDGGDKLVLLHRVQPGPANRSFGLQVAALAGIPKPVVEQARAYLKTLEQFHLPAKPAPQALST